MDNACLVTALVVQKLRFCVMAGNGPSGVGNTVWEGGRWTVWPRPPRADQPPWGGGFLTSTTSNGAEPPRRSKASHRTQLGGWCQRVHSPRSLNRSTRKLATESESVHAARDAEGRLALRYGKGLVTREAEQLGDDWRSVQR